MPLAYRVPGTGQERLIAERRQGGAKQFDPACLCPQCHLVQAGDHLFGGDLLFGLGVAVAQIVGAEHNDRMGHAGLRQHVAIEPPQPAVAAQIVQDLVAAEPLVHHPERPATLPCDQPPGQLVGPAAIGVMGRDIAVGQRVAERDHAAGLVRRQHIDAADEEPFVGDLADRHRDGGGKIARRRDVIKSAGHSAR